MSHKHLQAVQPSPAQGVISIHSAPAALCPHVEWAIGRIMGAPATLTWIEQPAQPGTRRTEYTWRAPVGSGAKLASTLGEFGRIRYEITEVSEQGAERFAFTPTLGAFHCAMGSHGETLVNEHVLQGILAQSAGDADAMAEGIRRALGTAWDEELDVFRYATEEMPVRWLHEVVG